MKNHLFLLLSIFTFSLILAGCRTSEKNEGNETKLESTDIQNEKNVEDIKEDTSKVTRPNLPSFIIVFN